MNQIMGDHDSLHCDRCMAGHYNEKDKSSEVKAVKLPWKYLRAHRVKVFLLASNLPGLFTEFNTQTILLLSKR